MRKKSIIGRILFVIAVNEIACLVLTILFAILLLFVIAKIYPSIILLSPIQSIIVTLLVIIVGFIITKIIQRLLFEFYMRYLG